LADHFGVHGSALRTFHEFLVAEQGLLVGFGFKRCGNTIFFERLSSGGCDPVGGQAGDKTSSTWAGIPFSLKAFDIVANDIHRRTTAVGGRNDDLRDTVLHFGRTNDTHIHNGQHRNLGIRNRLEDCRELWVYMCFCFGHFLDASLWTRLWL
jgi:hypothetical protein